MKKSKILLFGIALAFGLCNPAFAVNDTRVVSGTCFEQATPDCGDLPFATGLLNQNIGNHFMSQKRMRVNVSAKTSTPAWPTSTSRSCGIKWVFYYDPSEVEPGTIEHRADVPNRIIHTWTREVIDSGCPSPLPSTCGKLTLKADDITAPATDNVDVITIDDAPTTLFDVWWLGRDQASYPETATVVTDPVEYRHWDFGSCDFLFDDDAENTVKLTVIPECGDGIDNDGDGDIDDDDDVCATPTYLATYGSEVTRCADDIDNDGDGKIDWAGGSGGEAKDPQCSDNPRKLNETASNCGLLGAELFLFPGALAFALGRRKLRRA